MKLLWASLIIGLLLSMPVLNLSALAQTHGNTYYVATSGNDNHSGTIDQPWKTIQHAVDMLMPGDTVYVRGGVYYERVFLTGSSGNEGKSGNESEGHITYAAYPGEQVILDGTGLSWGSSFLSGKHASRSQVGNPAMDYIKIKGFEIRNYPAYGIAFENDQETPSGSHASHHIIIEDCIVHDNGNVGILFEGGDESANGTAHDIVIRNCESYKNGNHGIKFTGDEPEVINRERIHDSIIENCISHDNDYIGIHVSTGHYNITVRNNTVFNNGRQGLAAHEIQDSQYVDNLVYGNGKNDSDEQEGIIIWRSENVTVSRNVVYSNEGYGIRLWEKLSGVGSSPIIENNVIFKNNGGGLKISGDVQDGMIYHNSIAANQGIGLILATSVSGFDIKNNILNNNYTQVEAGSGNSFDYNLYFPDISFSQKGAHSITEDPLFVDPANNDYHLQANSPAIDKGQPLSSVTTDNEGNSRPQGAGYEIGAYEYGSSSPTPTFQDVPLDHWAYDYIEALYQEGYIVGCSLNPLLYCPEQIMTRAESAVFVERGIHNAGYMPSDPTQQIFDDVALTEWHAKWSSQLWEDGYTSGCGTDPLTYCPLQEHTIAEGCVFYLRMMKGADYEPQEATGIFTDVPVEAWYARWVEQAYTEGILLPCQTEPDLMACPLDGLDRAMGAYMMVQAKGLLAD
jgi:parallel beta-helix repeat protein